MVTTLKSKWHFALLAMLLYLTAPIVEAVYYRIEDGRGVYPPNADSIGIPIYAFTTFLAILSPVYALAVWLAVRSYQGGRPLLAFDMTRPVPSALWSLLLGGVALYNIGDAAYSAYRILPVDMIADLLWTYLFLCLRSSLAGSGEMQPKRLPA